MSQRRIGGTDAAFDRLYRCISADRWESGIETAHLTKLAPPFLSGRWNDQWQFALYASHSPDTAVAEKRRHLLEETVSTTVAGSLMAARSSSVPRPRRRRVVVVSFDLPASHHQRMFDVRELRPAEVQACLDRCSYWHARRVFAWKVRLDGHIHLLAPSSPRPKTLNSVIYCGGWRQPPFKVLPRRDEVVAAPPEWVAPDESSPCP